MQINVNQIRTLLNDIKLPDDYLTNNYLIKTDDISNSLNNIDEILDELGLSDINIGIKNMIGKLLLYFVVVCKVINENPNNRILVSMHDNIIHFCNGSNVITITYDEDEVIISSNISSINCNNFDLLKYANCTYKVNNSDKNKIIIKYSSDVYDNYYVSTFSDSGVEMKSDFVLRNVNADDQIMGSIERGVVYQFVTLTIDSIHAEKLNPQEVLNICGTHSVMIPLYYLCNNINTDLNLLHIPTNINGATSIEQLRNLFINYSSIYHYNWFNYWYQYGNKVFENVMSTDWYENIKGPFIHGIYSEEIMNNILNKSINYDLYQKRRNKHMIDLWSIPN